MEEYSNWRLTYYGKWSYEKRGKRITRRIGGLMKKQVLIGVCIALVIIYLAVFIWALWALPPVVHMGL